MSSNANLEMLLANMAPKLNPGRFVFATLPEAKLIGQECLIAAVREPEGLSVVVEESVAIREGLTAVFPCGWITLSVNSELETVGFTARFSSALASNGVSCNVIAGTHHDHIFVPGHLTNRAMEVLEQLQRRSAKMVESRSDT